MRLRGMNLLDKLLFVADYIEPNRNKAPDLDDVRRLAFYDLDQAALRILHDTIYYLNEKRGAVDSNTHDTYEYYLELLKSKLEKEEFDGFETNGEAGV